MKRVCLFLVAIIAFTVLPVMADDFAPPSYRGDPLSYRADWEFDTNPFPDFLPDLVSDGGPKTTEILYPGPERTEIRPIGVDWTWENGGIVNPLHDATLEIDVINWVDTEPEKFVRIQLTYSGGPAPTVLGAVGYEGGTTYGPFVPYSTVDVDLIHRYSDITMQPNPDWETIEIFVPQGTSIDEIVIDTVSIPEPSVIVMIFMMGGGLIFIRRKFMI